jgi:hypothetical protein
MAYECNECGEEIATGNGRYGHFRFTEGGGHGEKGEVPDDYKDQFTEIEGGGDGSEEPEPEGTTEGNGSADGSDDDSDGSGSAESSTSPDASESGGGGSGTDSDSRSLADRIRTALDTDVRELIGESS